MVLSNISAERYWDIRKPIPPIQINTNINIIGMEKKQDDTLEVPYVLSIAYNPSIAQITIKGNAYVNGEKNEIDKVIKDYEQKKPPAQMIIQSISNVVFIESVSISRTLNIPPPIPLPQIPEADTKLPNIKPQGRDYSF
ncbi:MAG: hypothetical protein FWB84_03975 [Candidatus Bathyarchaeota archaeon]|uniref:hypothetical protein n=1 Tax=Candidatus Bathycorpusculum sp. TaxID=2994959 RepID=UPI002829E4FF|nr:hypothetical protein [Candidatus Termiticorpusculum sp.]MCL2257784.1 hypothetical protein [Candidatus Termiticorpusculum sp.]MCL2292088.1 hypothetical protein [Candidatus Termiticorpusculum sp.]